MAYSINVIDAGKRQIKDSMSGYVRLLPWTRLGDFGRNAIFSQEKIIIHFEN